MYSLEKTTLPRSNMIDEHFVGLSQGLNKFLQNSVQVTIRIVYYLVITGIAVCLVWLSNWICQPCQFPPPHSYKWVTITETPFPTPVEDVLVVRVKLSSAKEVPAVILQNSFANRRKIWSWRKGDQVELTSKLMNLPDYWGLTSPMYVVINFRKGDL